jgi:flagellar motor switch protein FliM
VAEEVKARVRELMAEVQVGSVLQFPTMKIHAAKIAELGVGSVLRLPMPRHAAAELKVIGLPLGPAWPVRLGEHRGARMEGIEEPAPASPEPPARLAG